MITFKVLEYILDSIYEGVYIIDNDFKIVFYNNSTEILSGYKKFEVLEKESPLRFTNDRDKDVFDKSFLQNKNNEFLFKESTVFLHHKADYKVPVTIKILPYNPSGSKTEGLIILLKDATPKIVENEKRKALAQIAFFDNIVNIKNRYYLEMKINTYIESIKNVGKPFSVLFFEISNLKEINDKFGHNAGDNALKFVANSISENINKKYITGRWEGARIMILLPNSPKAVLLLLAEKVKNLVRTYKFAVNVHDIEIDISVCGLEVSKNITPNKLYEKLSDTLKEAKNLNKTIIK